MTDGADMIIGLIALALVPLIGWRIVRGVREGVLPVYRTSINRADDRAKFNALLGLHIISLVAVAVIGADLLFGLELRN